MSLSAHLLLVAAVPSLTSLVRLLPSAQLLLLAAVWMSLLAHQSSSAVAAQFCAHVGSVVFVGTGTVSGNDNDSHITPHHTHSLLLFFPSFQCGYCQNSCSYLAYHSLPPKEGNIVQGTIHK
jgi:hypothetical protein